MELTARHPPAGQLTRVSEGDTLSSLTHLRGRITALGGVIVLLLVAGVWIVLTHAPAEGSDLDGAGNDAKPVANASPTTQAPVGPLRLVSVTPASHAMDANGAADITVQFSAPLAAGSPLPTIRPLVPGTWQGAGTSSLTFDPARAFRQHTRVTVKIPGGPLGVRSTGGGLLVRTAQIRFRTGGLQAGTTGSAAGPTRLPAADLDPGTRRTRACGQQRDGSAQRRLLAAAGVL